MDLAAGTCSQLPFQFIPKEPDGVEVRALCKPVKFFNTKLRKQFRYGDGFVHGDIVMLKQERSFTKLFTQSWKYSIVQKITL